MNFAPSYSVSTLALWCLALLLGATPAWALSPKQSLASAAQELAKASPATRAAFVEAAVAELTAAHRAVARRSTKTGKAGPANPRDKKTAGWNKDTLAYIGRLQSAAAAARAGAPVRLVVDRGRLLRVVVGRQPARQFIIAAPQPRGGPALERAILRRLCAVDACGSLAPTSASSEPPLTTLPITAPSAQRMAGSATPATPLTSYRPVTPPRPPAPRLVSSLSSTDGLACAQDEVRHHVLYDNACQALLADVRALVKALHAAAKRGVAIDWTMPSRPVNKGASYELAVNGRSDTVRLAMPTLGDAPELLVDILPWAHARLLGTYQALALRPPSRLIYGAAIAAR